MPPWLGQTSPRGRTTLPKGPGTWTWAASSVRRGLKHDSSAMEVSFKVTLLSGVEGTICSKSDQTLGDVRGEVLDCLSISGCP